MSVAASVTKQVHDDLVPVLAEHSGDSVRVLEAPNPAEGFVKYGYTEDDCRCEAGVVACNARAAAVCVTVRVGRLYVGYRRALRWLAFNRAGNSVGFMASEDAVSRQELWLCSHRVTLPGDAAGIREMLLDVRLEVERVFVGMRSWFPQLLAGAQLTELEEAAHQEGNDVLKAVLQYPQGFREWLRDHPGEAAQVNPSLAAQVLGWLGCWSEQLPALDRLWEQMPAEERTPAAHANWLVLRIRGLLELGRAPEALPLARQLRELVKPEQWTSAVTGLAATLYALGQYEDIAEELRGAEFDHNPRVWYWRSLAEARLGNVRAAAEAYRWYERGIGADCIGRKKLRDALPPNADALAGDEAPGE